MVSLLESCDYVAAYSQINGFSARKTDSRLQIEIQISLPRSFPSKSWARLPLEALEKKLKDLESQDEELPSVRFFSTYRSTNEPN